jgi:hypothetical protein
VLGLISEPTLVGQLESELVFLVNASCVVHGVSVSSGEDLRRQASEVRDLISLGLELHAKDDLAEAARAIEKHPLRAFISVALGQVFKLADWARRAEGEGLFRLPGILRRVLTPDDEHFLTTLLGKFPRYGEQLGSVRAFGSRSDLATAKKRLENMAKMLLCVRWLGSERKDFGERLAGCSPGPSEITPETFLRSFLVLRALGGRDNLAVSDSDIAAFAKLCPRGAPWPKEAWPKDLDPELSARFGELCSDIDDAGVKADARFLGLVTQEVKNG